MSNLNTFDLIFKNSQMNVDKIEEWLIWLENKIESTSFEQDSELIFKVIEYVKKAVNVRFKDNEIIQEKTDLIISKLTCRDGVPNSKLFPINPSKKFLYHEIIKTMIKDQFSFEDGSSLNIHQAVAMEKINSSQHSMLTAKTSFGKTFIVKGLIEKNNFKNVMYIATTKALIREQTDELSDFFNKKEIKIRHSFPIFSEAPQNTAWFTTHDNFFDLFSSVSKKNIPELIVFDEAHNLAKKNLRGLLYHKALKHSISFKKHNIKVVSLSPIGKLEDESLKSIKQTTSHYKSIGKNIFFWDKVKENFLYFDDMQNKDVNLYEEGILKKEDVNFSKLSKGKLAIHFIESIEKSFEHADVLTKQLKACVWNKEQQKTVEEFKKKIKTTFGAEHPFIKYIDYGVVLHNGKLPSNTVVAIEEIIKDPNKIIKHIITTSALLEGVNISAEVIFILKATILKQHKSKEDIINLMGRAGRSGKANIANVFFVGDSDENMEEYYNYAKNYNIEETRLFLEEDIKKIEKKDQELIKENNEIKNNRPNKLLDNFSQSEYEDIKKIKNEHPSIPNWIFIVFDKILKNENNSFQCTKNSEAESFIKLFMSETKDALNTDSSDNFKFLLWNNLKKNKEISKKPVVLSENQTIAAIDMWLKGISKPEIYKMFSKKTDNRTNISNIWKSNGINTSQKIKIIFHGGGVKINNKLSYFQSGLVSLTEDVISFKLYTLLKVFYKVGNIIYPDKIKFDPSPFIKFGTFNDKEIFLQELGIDREFASKYLKILSEKNGPIEIDDFQGTKFSKNEITKYLDIIKFENT